VNDDKAFIEIDLKRRANVIRQHIVKMIGKAGSGHPGGSLSAADIITVLFFDEMNIDVTNPKWTDRDRFVLCKGHSAPALYAALAEKGFFDIKELDNLRKLGSMLQGHPDMNSTPGVDMSTGSLGQGLSVANGMAISAKMDKKDYRVYALLGDGEIEEGQVWEAAMMSSHRKLDNLVAIIDNNGLQIDGDVFDVKSLKDIAGKFKSFGWNVIEIDGHDILQIKDALKQARNTFGMPTAIVAKTIKGKGVSFMENQAGWHGTAPKPDQVELAIRELDAEIEKVGANK